MNPDNFDYFSFYDCISVLCKGFPLHPDLKEAYKSDKDRITDIQDHIGLHCPLVNIHNFPTLAVVEMAEAYANYKE